MIIYALHRVHVILRYTVIVVPIQFALLLMQTPDFSIGRSPPSTHTHPKRAFSMLYGCCNSTGCRSFTNSSPCIYPAISPKDFEFWFFSTTDFVSLLYRPFFLRRGRLEPFIRLALSSVVSCQQFCHTGQLYWVFSPRMMLTFFHNDGSIVPYCLSSVTQDGTWSNCPEQR